MMGMEVMVSKVDIRVLSLESGVRTSRKTKSGIPHSHILLIKMWRRNKMMVMEEMAELNSYLYPRII